MRDPSGDSLWPNGTDYGGLRAMGQGLVSSFLMHLSVYLGTSAVRGIVLQIAGDDEFWKLVSKVAPVQRAALAEKDREGAELDDAELKNGAGN